MPDAGTSPNRAREALLAAAIASSDDGIVVIDEASRIALFNFGAERMFGWSEIEAIGQPLEILIPAASRTRHAAFVSDFAGGTVNTRRMNERQDVTALRRDGTEFPVAASITRVRLESSTFFVAIVRDVSVRQHATDMLAAKTRQLETIAAAMTTFLENRDWGAANQVLVQGALAETQSEYGFAGVVVDGPVLRILAHAGIIWHGTENRALYETALREYQERGYLEFRNFNNLFGLVITSGRVVLSNDPAQHAARGGLPAGHPPLSSFLGVPIMSGTETVGIIAVANRPGGYGVPEQAAIELLAQMAGVLFDSYLRSQREQHLEEQVQQAQKLDAVGRLATGIAHDFNNLLTVILGLASDLVEEPPATLPHEVQRDIEEIRKAGERAADLTRQLLAFSRKQIVRPAVLNLNAVIASLEMMLRRLVEENIEFRTALASDLGCVRADVSLIGQVLVNLVVNARDAMPAGGQLTIETANVELDNAYSREHASVTPGRYAMVAISDTGVGMSPEVRARLFEPFFTTKEVGKGTGLGLATVYGIVSQSGGSIWVYSEPNQGATFKVYLPLVDEPAVALSPAGGGEQAQRGSETVLLAEDEDAVRALATRALLHYGYTVLEARNAEEALRVAGGHAGPIHLLLTDVVMPGMSGRLLAQRVAERHPGMKVLYMSGYPDDAIVRHGVLEPGIRLLEKPFTPKMVQQLVREVLDTPVDGAR